MILQILSTRKILVVNVPLKTCGGGKKQIVKMFYNQKHAVGPSAVRNLERNTNDEFSYFFDKLMRKK